MNRKKQQQRRELLKRFAAVSLLGSGATAMGGKLGLIGSALAANSDYEALTDYKALVCVFLFGGSDSYSMFVPTDTARYDEYAASRAGLAVPRENLLTSSGNSGIGFHPLLPDLHNLFTTGDLSVMANVGNLIAPVSKSQFISKSPLVPADLFAHNHQQEQWLKGLSSSPASIVGSGWGGRMADLLQHANTDAVLPPSFSLAGNNYWLPGRDIQPIGLNPITGLSLLNYLDDQSGSQGNALREATLDEILGNPGNHPLKQQAALSMARAKSGSGQLAATLNANSSFNTSYDADSRLAQQLRMVARMIAGNQQLGMKRQIFFVGAGDWDTHDNQTPRLEALLANLNRSLSDFHTTMNEINMADSVTTFTASDFGRTLTINGDGSDHGWGGNYMVMGGAVNGGQLNGQLPSFEIGGDDDSGDKGRIIPSMSINQYGSLLAKWMGVTDSDLNDVFPDLSNFGSDWQNGIELFTSA